MRRDETLRGYAIFDLCPTLVEGEQPFHRLFLW